ncbi:MAG: acyltransferase [Betaproteobacteria bacterium]|nr:acyltransferase [Betaproteobacteria bacterium]
MNLFKILRPKFALGLIRNILLKIHFRDSLDINIFRTYFAPSVKIHVSGGGKIKFAHSGKRIYVADGCELTASGGILNVGEGVFFNRNCTVVTHENIFIGAHCMFGSGVCIFDSDHAFDRLDIPFSEQGYKRTAVSLGENVWIGANTVITRGTQICRNVVVGANFLTKGTLDEAHVYGGNPLKMLRSIAPSQSN